jgi:hypothetical protein
METRLEERSQLILSSFPTEIGGVPAQIDFKGEMEKIKSILLPEWTKIQEIALFKKKEARDPVLAIRVGNEWYQLYEWK